MAVTLDLSGHVVLVTGGARGVGLGITRALLGAGATVVSGLSGTYIGGIGSSAGPTEMMMAFFGGTSQDHHHYAAVFPRSNPSNLQLVDTLASTVNGQPTPIVLNFSLHHVAIDRSGRYVMLYTTSADQAALHAALVRNLYRYVKTESEGGPLQFGPGAPR